MCNSDCWFTYDDEQVQLLTELTDSDHGFFVAKLKIMEAVRGKFQGPPSAATLWLADCLAMVVDAMHMEGGPWHCGR